MTEMVGRVAKALRAAGVGLELDPPEATERLARIAIGALKEPTNVMLAAGIVAYRDRDGAYPVWQAMVDEALKE